METAFPPFHHYQLMNHLFHGAGHDTYLAVVAEEPEQRVVLKVFEAACLAPQTTPSDVRQLEARLQRLQHPHIVAVRELAIEQGRLYLVSEYLEGGSLRAYLDQRASGHLPLEEAVGVIMQVGRAVAFAHTQGMLHQQIRPENIVLDAQGKVLLTDFRLSDMLRVPEQQSNGNPRVLSYQAPECNTGAATIASDQYALGCLLFELMTGSLPEPTALQQHATQRDQGTTGEVPPPPRPVATLLLRTLASQPDERYPDVATFLAELKAAVQPEPPAFPFAHLTSGFQHTASSEQHEEEFPPLVPNVPMLLRASLPQEPRTAPTLPVDPSLEAFLTTPEWDGVSLLDRLGRVDGQEEATLLSDIAERSASSNEHASVAEGLDEAENQAPAHGQAPATSLGKNAPAQTPPDKQEAFVQSPGNEVSTQAAPGKEASFQAPDKKDAVQSLAGELPVPSPRKEVFSSQNELLMEEDDLVFPTTRTETEKETDGDLSCFFGENTPIQLPDKDASAQAPRKEIFGSQDELLMEEDDLFLPTTRAEADDDLVFPLMLAETEEEIDGDLALPLTHAGIAEPVGVVPPWPAGVQRTGWPVLAPQPTAQRVQSPQGMFQATGPSYSGMAGSSPRKMLPLLPSWKRPMVWLAVALALTAIASVLLYSFNAAMIIAVKHAPVATVATPFPTRVVTRPKPTPIPRPRPTARPTSIPTPTPTSAPTRPPAPAPTQPPDIYTQATSGTPVYSSSMTGPDSANWSTGNWVDQNGQLVSCNYTSNGYQIRDTDPGETFFTSFNCNEAAITMSDFAFQVNVVTTAGDGGGILFRSTDSDAYSFRVSPDGSYDLAGYEQDVSGSSSAIHKGLNQSNLVTIIARGSNVYIYVNRQQIIHTTNLNPTSGVFGLFAVSVSQATTILFNDMKIWQG